LKVKGEAFEKFKQYKPLVENEISHKTKCYDLTMEENMCRKSLTHFLRNVEFNDKTSAPYSPQQNDVAKRANRTIIECARNMILAQRLDLEFLGEAVNMAVYIKNRCPIKALDSKTP
jgi:hypothetical protein